jgi:hypothetical protein
MAAKTRLGEGGYGVRRAGSFARTTSLHPVGVITRLTGDGYGGRRYRSFAGKTASEQTSQPVYQIIEQGGGLIRARKKRKTYEELVEQIRQRELAEQYERQAPARAKQAREAVRDAEKAAAKLSADLQLRDAEELARAVVAAKIEANAKEAVRLSNEVTQLMARIKRRMEDEEDDEMALLMLLN